MTSEDNPGYQEEPTYLTLENLWRAIVVAVAAFLLWMLLSDTSFGQGESPNVTVEPSASLEIEQWASPHKTYMNRIKAEGTVEIRWGQFWAEGTASGIWWGSGRSKVAGSLLNTESGKTIERRRSAALGLRFKASGTWTLRLGAVVQRRGVHHIWQYKRPEGRHDYFPGNWQAGVAACGGGQAPDWPPGANQCPSIGYWDLASPLLILEGRWEKRWVRARIEAPMRRWKTLTLPYPRAKAILSARLYQWRIRARSTLFGPAGTGYDAKVSRSIPGARLIRLGLVASGRLSDPGWGKGPGDNLRRIGATLTVGAPGPGLSP
jgi:hypothetical protein